jgi:glucose-1-phosphate adenylyltransferase
MRILAMVLAGGEGRRLAPLTRDRAKPAVPFGGRYRIIDFVLSNLVNSRIFRINVLTQYKSESLNRHLARTWALSTNIGHYVASVPAQQRTGTTWYQGSADAIYQNLNLIADEKPDIVAVFGGDHVYKMDVRQMVDFHMAKGADTTVATIPFPLDQCKSFGVCNIDAEHRMTSFVEKPKKTDSMPGKEGFFLASMGNYLFNTEALIREVKRDARDAESAHDFGKNIISSMVGRANVFAYDFATNVVPGMEEKERGYWRDVGSLETYYESNMDLVHVDPVFNLYNQKWPIYAASANAPPAKFIFQDEKKGRVGQAHDSLISEGVIVSGGSVRRSILSPYVRVNSFSEVDDSILLANVSVGRYCKLRRVIVDKNVEIPPKTRIGFDPEEDRTRGFTVTEEGLTVIPAGTKIKS